MCTSCDLNISGVRADEANHKHSAKNEECIETVCECIDLSIVRPHRCQESGHTGVKSQAIQVSRVRPCRRACECVDLSGVRPYESKRQK